MSRWYLASGDITSGWPANVVSPDLVYSFERLIRTNDEGRVDGGLFNVLSDKLIDHSCVGAGFRALNLHLVENVLEELVGLGGVQLVRGRELLAGGLLKRRNHVHAPPGASPVYLYYFLALQNYKHDVIYLVLLSALCVVDCLIRALDL